MVPPPVRSYTSSDESLSELTSGSAVRMNDRFPTFSGADQLGALAAVASVGPDRLERQLRVLGLTRRGQPGSPRGKDEREHDATAKTGRLDVPGTGVTMPALAKPPCPA